MKKITSVFLALTVFVLNLLIYVPFGYASTKKESTRTIAIVFDNSGSMYDEGDQAWCRATYAMEVFASMLNEGDILQIYPMHPITADEKEYTMHNPLQITDAARASVIRDILTNDAGGTPIESIDCAVEGLKAIPNGKKYLIVLTDGGTFSKNNNGLSKDRTKIELDKRIQAQAGKDMTVMYLGIGSDACIPTVKQSDYFVKKQAVNTADVLSTLTQMCNLIFGRDTLPANRISENKINFDITMSKLIVFVQGENISDLKISALGDPVSSQQTKFSTKGAADYKSVPDTSLQGMMVTYEDCAAGEYTIEYSGNATNVEVYYEPDADLEFVFTDSQGNNVDLNSLYEGEYKVSFGLKDAKTGNLISSDLLGNPHYEGTYTINGEKTSFSHDGYNGEVPVTLKMNDTFEADLTVTYLSGYTITKNSSDFGWPEGGVRVLAPPLGNFEVKMTVPQDYILINDIENSKPIIVDLLIDGNKLTADEFNSVNVQIECDEIVCEVTPDEAESNYRIQLKTTEGIKEGNYKIKAIANYSDEAERTANAEDTGKITLSHVPLWLKRTISILLFLLLLILIWIIMHIKVLPNMHTTKKLSSMNFDGDDVTKSTNFMAEIKKKSAKMQGQYAGKKFGISMDVVPGKESYLYKPQKRRSAEVKVASVKKFGPAKIQEAMIGSAKYVADENTGKLVPALPNQKPFTLTNGMVVKYSGTIQDAGIDKDFEVTSKLNFKKK